MDIVITNMGQVSRRKLPLKLKERIFNLFLSGLSLCSSAEKVALLVDDLLTPTEKIMLAKRFCIAFMLINNYDYRTIKDTLKVSLTTVGAVSFWLKEKGNGYRAIIKNIKAKEQTNKIWEEIVDGIEDYLSLVPGKNWSESRKLLWQHRREREKPF